MGASVPTAAAADPKKLTINQRLKKVLSTKLMLSNDNADNICNEICTGK